MWLRLRVDVRLGGRGGVVDGDTLGDTLTLLRVAVNFADHVRLHPLALCLLSDAVWLPEPLMVGDAVALGDAVRVRDSAADAVILGDNDAVRDAVRLEDNVGSRDAVSLVDAERLLSDICSAELLTDAVCCFVALRVPCVCDGVSYPTFRHRHAFTCALLSEVEHHAQLPDDCFIASCGFVLESLGSPEAQLQYPPDTHWAPRMRTVS